MSQSNARLRVVMVIDQFHPIVGGAERQCLQLSQGLVAQGHAVTVLTRQVESEMMLEDDLSGVRVVRLPYHGQSHQSRLRALAPATSWLKAHQNEYDLVHCHGCNPLEWSAWLAQRSTGRPYVVKLTRPNFMEFAVSSDQRRQESGQRIHLAGLARPVLLPILKSFRLRTLRNASAIIAISDEISQRLTELEISAIRRIPNGVDTFRFEPVEDKQKADLREQLKLDRAAFVAVYAGRISAVKNLETLIEAWRQLKGQLGDTPLKLLVVGSAQATHQDVETQLKVLAGPRTDSNIRFTGNVENVSEYLQAADAFVLPTAEREGMSNSLLEAMSAGLTCVVSDIPGNTALVQHDGNGLVFPPRDVAALTLLLARAAQDRSLRQKLGAEARQTILTNYSREAVLARILELYRDVTQSSGV